MDWGTGVLWLGVAAAGYLLLRMLAEPAGYLLLALGRGVFGYAVLWVLNGVGLLFGLSLPLNPFTALVAGILGVPGILAVWAMQRLYS